MLRRIALGEVRDNGVTPSGPGGEDHMMKAAVELRDVRPDEVTGRKSLEQALRGHLPADPRRAPAPGWRRYLLRSACQLGASSEITFDPDGRKEAVLEILEYP